MSRSSISRLLEQWEESLARGKEIAPEELCRDAPEQAAELASCVNVLRRMNRLTDQLAQSSNAGKETPIPPEEQPTVDPTVRGWKLPPAVTDSYAEVTPSAKATTSGEWPTLPDYEVLSELGHGGMGVVYRARQVRLNRIVALKMILAGHVGAEEQARFRGEAEAIARLAHANIVQIYEIGEYEGQPFFSMEFCSGGSLEQKLKNASLPARAAAEVVQTLATAVHAAHQARVVHRDLKPGNVLLAADGTPKITDFGLAKKLGEVGQTQTGEILGTPSYMAPEQARGETARIGPAVDVYALGAILYECLTGRPPFKAATVMESLMQVIHEEPVPPTRLASHCPRDLETICLKCLQKDPGKRYATAQALAEDLQRYLDGRTILARPAGSVEKLAKWVRRSPARAAAVAAGLAFALTLLAGLFVEVRSAQKDVELFRQQDELRQRQFAELRRREELRSRFTDLFSQAEKRAIAAAAGDSDAWAAVERDARASLELIATEPAFADFPLREPARHLLARAQGERADARVRAEHRAHLLKLKTYHGDAVFFGSLSAGLELRESLKRTRAAVSAGLALFGVTPETSGPPIADPRFYNPAEIKLITAYCYELLLLDAEVLARPGVGDTTSWHGRLRQALRLLDRADRLQPGLQTHSGWSRRAEYLKALGKNEAAARARKAATEIAPSLAADHFLVGMEHYRREDFKGAERSLASTLRLQPRHYGAEYLLAVCRLREGQAQAARIGLTRCLEQRPNFLWPRLLRGYAEMELGEFGPARADFEAVLKNPPDPLATYVALVNRGVLAMRRRLWDEAVSDLERAIALHPKAVVGHVNLALVYRQRVNTDPRQLAALLLAPRGAFAFATMEIHRAQGYAQAVSALDEAIRRQPSVARLYHERGRLHLQLHQLRQAREDFTRAVALAPGVGRTSTLADDLIELGRLLHGERQYAQAVKVFQAALLVSPEHIQASQLLAQSLFALGQYERAGQALDRYLAAAAPVGRQPTSGEAGKLAEAFRARGLLHMLQDHFRAALDSCTQALELRREPETLALRGWTYLLYQAPRLALEDFDEALKLQPELGEALVGRADALVKLGRIAEAVADVEEGLRKEPGSSRLRYHAGRVYCQAAAALRLEGTGPRRLRDTAASYEDRAAELLREALTMVPADERDAFWRNYVEADNLLWLIRTRPALRELLRLSSLRRS